MEGAMRKNSDGGAATTVVMAMGNNSDGQLGCGLMDDDDDKVFEPCEIRAFEQLNGP